MIQWRTLIDGLAPVRSSKTDQIHNSIVATLLALMDGLDSRGRVVVLGATNRVDAIDGALRRPAGPHRCCSPPHPKHFYSVLPPVVSSIGDPLIVTVERYQIETRVENIFGNTGEIRDHTC